MMSIYGFNLKEYVGDLNLSVNIKIIFLIETKQHIIMKVT